MANQHVLQFLVGIAAGEASFVLVFADGRSLGSGDVHGILVGHDEIAAIIEGRGPGDGEGHLVGPGLVQHHGRGRSRNLHDGVVVGLLVVDLVFVAGAGRQKRQDRKGKVGYRFHGINSLRCSSNGRWRVRYRASGWAGGTGGRGNCAWRLPHTGRLPSAERNRP